MITNEELQISNKSYIDKDFQTIYPELIEIFKKLTNIVNPEAMNESDPLIVLLKLLAFIGDKCNYNIDKNILEAFLPSATQETSVRQILEMMGYNKKYYQSASTLISILYQGDVSTSHYVYLAPFETMFTDENNSITYTLLEEVNIFDSNTTYPALVTEGTPKDLTINGNTTIQLSNLDDNLRLYFPETMIAQNRIYVKNVESDDWNTSGTSEDGWSRVDNLNLYSPKSKKFKFGFDSNKNLPYIQFPDDIIELIGSGLNVKYFITIGAGGNISRGKLTVLSSPSQDSLYYYTNNAPTEENVVLVDELNNQNLLRIFNYYASTNGANPETIDEAYNNYKKTVGTFETLVTPRDFANWLYSFIDSESSYPLVSNIQVSDRRIDTTFYQPIVTYNEYGTTTDYVYVHGKDISDNTLPTVDTITPFDLVLYPLKQVNTYSIYDKNGNIQATNYDASFTPSDAYVKLQLISEVRETQSVDHTYVQVYATEPYLYKNYYKLNIKVSTIDKVNDVERRTIINNIKQALFDNFNSRKLDYGYEIPIDALYSVILNSDTRIKNVSLDDPEITTKFMLGDGTEHTLSESSYSGYIDMIARNVLAGRINLYNYVDTFEFDETMQDPVLINNVETLEPTLDITAPTDYLLGANQIVQLFSDSFSTSQTATVGVNFYWIGNNLVANEPHKIGESDPSEVLYLSYTNSDGLLRTYKYTADTIYILNESGVIISQKLGTTLISPNFEMVATGNTGTINVNSDMVNDPKFDSLSSNEEIGFLKKNEKVFNKDTYYFYWKLNNTNNVLFAQSTDEYRILGEDEYFMYTDSSKSSVEIFSSGTKISRDGLSTLTNMSCNAVDTSELVDGDLSTYAGIDWKQLNFNNSNNTLTIKQQKILTLTAGDKITFNQNIGDDLYTFEEGDRFTYQIVGEDSVPVDYNALYEYNIRTRLDVVSGPNISQTLKTGEQIAYTGSTSGTLTDGDTFITNYPIQRSGNGVIDTKLSGDTFNVIKYDEVARPETTYGIMQSQGKQYKIELKDISGSASIIFNVPILSGKDTTFMIYFNKKQNDDAVDYINDGTTISLVNGVNMVTPTDSSVELDITSSVGTDSYIIIDEIKITDGLNKVFNLNDLGISESSVTSAIDNLKGNEVGFYSTYSIPYSKIIDVDDFYSSNVMWDKNNVLNKFTLAQIDFENSNIDVLKSSRK